MQLFLLRAAGFLLPCYIMAWAISILQQRRQRQVSAVLKFMIFAPYLFMSQTLLFTKVDVIGYADTQHIFDLKCLLHLSKYLLLLFPGICILIISCFGKTGGCSIGVNPSCFRATIWAAQGTAVCHNTSSNSESAPTPRTSIVCYPCMEMERSPCKFDLLKCHATLAHHFPGSNSNITRATSRMFSLSLILFKILVCLILFSIIITFIYWYINLLYIIYSFCSIHIL